VLLLTGAGALTLGALLASASCGPDPGPPCPDLKPSFSVLIENANGEPLPPATVLRLKYGGSGIEEFHLDAPSTPQVMFCRPAERDGGATSEPADAGDGGDAGDAGGAPSVEALYCDLWTEGPATLEIDAGDVQETRDLEVQRNACTVAVTIDLGADAGS
jgi:hypothetical protein